MDATTALQKRTAGKTQFTRHENRLEDALDDKDLDDWTLNKRYADFKERFDKVQDLNEDYVAMLKEEEDIIQADQWIDDLVKRFDALESLVGKKLKSLKESELPSVKSETKEQPKQAKHSIMKPKKFELEIFHGDIRRYPEFKSVFLQLPKALGPS